MISTILRHATTPPEPFPTAGEGFQFRTALGDIEEPDETRIGNPMAIISFGVATVSGALLGVLATIIFFMFG